MHSLHKYGTALAVLLMTLIVVCGPRTAPVQAADSIVYRLKWLFNASVIGDIYAHDRRYFDAQGLDVRVKEGGPERDAIRELELGRAQFGVASADQVIRAMAKGAEIVVLAQLFQVNPLQWIYRTDQMNIDHLRDLKGRTLGVTFGGNDEAILRTLLAKGGLSQTEVELFSVRYDYTPFFQKKVHFWPVYRNTQAVFLAEKLRAAGEPFAFFNPADFGVRFVANSVVTSRAMMTDQPEVVKKFSAALLAAWRAAMDPANARKSLRTLQKYDRETPLATLRRQLDITRELIQPDPAVPIGTIDVEAWRQTEQIMLEQELIEAPVGVRKILESTLPAGR
jgi:NitT/TauT family transport system substrate-binding protein